MTRRGVTLIEIVVAMTIGVALIMVMTRLLKVPVAVSGWASDAQVQQVANVALDRWVKDLKEGVPNSFSAGEQSAHGTLAFTKLHLDPDHKADPRLSQIAYQFRPTSDDSGSLYRVQDGSDTVILPNIQNPTAEDPMFTLDTDLRLVMISLRIRPQGRPALRFVRRVTLSH